MAIYSDSSNKSLTRSDIVNSLKEAHNWSSQYKDKSLCEFLIKEGLGDLYRPVKLPCGRVVSNLTRENIFEYLRNFFTWAPYSSYKQIIASITNKIGTNAVEQIKTFRDKKLMDNGLYDINVSFPKIGKDDPVPVTIEFKPEDGEYGAYCIFKINTQVRFSICIKDTFGVIDNGASATWSPETWVNNAATKVPDIVVESWSCKIMLNSQVMNIIDSSIRIKGFYGADNFSAVKISFTSTYDYTRFMYGILSQDELYSTTDLLKIYNIDVKGTSGDILGTLSATYEAQKEKGFFSGGDMNSFDFWGLKGYVTMKIPTLSSTNVEGQNLRDLELKSFFFPEATGDYDLQGNSTKTLNLDQGKCLGVIGALVRSDLIRFDTEPLKVTPNATTSNASVMTYVEQHIMPAVINEVILLCSAVGFTEYPKEYETISIRARTTGKIQSTLKILSQSDPYSFSFTGLTDSVKLVSGLSINDPNNNRKDVTEEVLVAPINNWLEILTETKTVKSTNRTYTVKSTHDNSGYSVTISSAIKPEDILKTFECTGVFNENELNTAFKDANYKLEGKDLQNNVNNVMSAAMSQAGLITPFTRLSDDLFEDFKEPDKVIAALNEKEKREKLAQARNKVDSLQYHTTMRNPATTFSSKMQKLDVDASMNIDKRERNEYGALGPLGLVEKVDSPASLRIYRQDNTTAGSNGIDQIYVDCFLLTDVQEVDEEKYSVFQSLNGDTLVQFFGRRPTTLNLSGILMDTKNQQWYNDFKYWYDNYLRGSAAIKNDSRIVLVYTDQIIEGFILSMNVQKNSTSNMSVHVNFTMLVVSHTPLATEWTDPEHSEIDRGYHRIQAHPDVDPDAESRFAAFMETVSGDLISDAALEDVAAKKDAAIDKEVKKTKLYGVLDYSSGSTIQSQAFNSRLFDPKLDISLSEVNPSLIASAKVQSSTGGNLSNAVNSEDSFGIKMSDFKLTLNAENGARNYRNMQEKSILDQVSYRILS